MDAASVIRKVRDAEPPSQAELTWFANGLASCAVSDAQAGAFAMAVLLNGLADQERVALTLAMRDSGDVLGWSLDAPVLDKHSTGGVGDCVSLVLAPALAACGVYVPMISGRGLGHTGGTLDKLEAIPGVNIMVDEPKLRQILDRTGCAIVGATGKIAPADKRLYAVRDVTSTVESIDLITASILSKKLAAGLQGLVLDVKVGSGAFMETPDDARALATALVQTANGAGCKTAAMITDMNQPLAPTLGNALEVAACMEVLSGNRLAAPRLHDLTVALGGRLLALAGSSEGEAEEMINSVISSGAAMERFALMISELGGPPDMHADWQTHLPKAPVELPVYAAADGVVSHIDGRSLGNTVVGLGGGRRVETDKIDPRVGITDVIRLGARVASGDLIAMVHAADDTAADAAKAEIAGAIEIGQSAPNLPLLHERIDP